MRDVPTRYGLPNCGHYGETLQCRLCDMLVSMQTMTMYHVRVPLLVLFVRSLGLDRLGRWGASDSRHGGLGGVVKWLIAAFDNEVSNVAR